MYNKKHVYNTAVRCNERKLSITVDSIVKVRL